MKIKEIVKKYKRISILSGAGISTLSGIPCYSGDAGIYNDEYKGFPIGGILSAYFYRCYQEVFFDYYFNVLVFQMENKMPNYLHEFAKNLASENKLELCITQNIDTLYEQTGLVRNKLCKIHGTYNRFICTGCHQEIKMSDMNKENGVMVSKCCKKLIKPKVVLYDENFDNDDFERYTRALENSDLLIVMGTGLDIMSHKQNVTHFKGDIMLINNENIDLPTQGHSRDWDYSLIDDFSNIKDELT